MKNISPRSDDIDALSSIHGASDIEDPLDRLEPHHKAPCQHNMHHQHNQYQHPAPDTHLAWTDDTRDSQEGDLPTTQNYVKPRPSATDQCDSHSWSAHGSNGAIQGHMSSAQGQGDPAPSNGLRGRQVRGQKPRVDGVSCPPPVFSHYIMREKATGVAQVGRCLGLSHYQCLC